MHAILQHCYFKAPLFHYKTLLVDDSSIGPSESLSDRTSSFKIGLVRLQNQIFALKKIRNIPALVLEGFVDRRQSAFWHSEM